MGYFEYLCTLLEPLHIYALDEENNNTAELFAAGSALDAAAERFARAERESILETAEDAGLSKRERLFARCPVNVSLPLRRRAIAALMQIGGDDFTLAAINRAINGCGISAEVRETDSTGVVQVSFPGTVGVPDGFAQIQEIILDIIPCHLLTEFWFLFLTWARCEELGYTWAEIEQADHDWESFQEAVYR